MKTACEGAPENGKGVENPVVEAGCFPSACFEAVLNERLVNSEATGAVAGVASRPVRLRDEAAGPSVDEGVHTKAEATGAVAGVASATACTLNEEAGSSSKEEARASEFLAAPTGSAATCGASCQTWLRRPWSTEPQPRFMQTCLPLEHLPDAPFVQPPRLKA